MNGHALNRSNTTASEVIAELNHKIQTKSPRLAELLANKQLLKQTVSRLEKKHQMEVRMKQNFAALKVNLSWPIHYGTVLPYFSTPIEQSELKWDGILIKSPEEQPVYAVASGKVVFAKLGYLDMSYC